VSPTPGTTRDYVDAELSIGASAVMLVDTAGIRGDAEAIEARGIDLARDQVAGADLVLWLEPADEAPTVLPIRDDVLRIETKRDLGTHRPDWIGATVTGDVTDVAEVERALHEWCARDREHAWIGLARHRDCAAEALQSLRRANDLLAADEPLELAAFELGIADARLGEITGHTSLGPIADDVLDRIFARFCIGK
jgi:tRNA modification GTPase